MNSAHLLGRLTRDPESRQVGGSTVAHFTLAVDRGKRKDGTKEVDFLDCQAWDKTADVVLQYAHKGDQLAVEGQIRVRTYEKDGQPRKAWEINVNRVHLIGGRRNADTASEEGGASDGDEPIPF